jgi:hypothetical protein
MPTTSGTYTFLPDNASLVLQAYSRCGLRRTSFTQEHMIDARTEINLMLASWANIGVNLWTFELASQALTQGVATYSCPNATIMMVDAYIETGTPAIGRMIYAISRSDYAALPNKTTQGYPTSFWFNRDIAPTITLWPVPDQDSVYTLRYWKLNQIQDANLTNGEIPDLPYRWLDAFVAGLAARLAAIYAPDRMQMLDKKAEEAYQIAANQDTENVPLSIDPMLEQYYR